MQGVRTEDLLVHSIDRCEVIYIVKEDSATHNAIQAGSGCLENCRDILRVVPHTGSITGANEEQISVLYAATPQL